jgi:nicotinamidase/pyrazinamidase
MSVNKYVLISMAIVLVLTVSVVALTVRHIYTPTRGKHIGKYANPGKALLVIDVQEDYTGSGKQPVLFRGVEGRIANINKLIDSSSKSAMEVVYIRQIFPDNLITRRLVGRTIEGQPGTELDSRIKIINRNDFTKKISDAFSNPRLEEFLIRNQIDELYLTGLDAAYCVYYTALGARNRGYKVTVVNDAVMTRKDMSEVLNRYKKDGIALTSSRELIGM